MENGKVNLMEVIEKFKLNNRTPSVDPKEIFITQSDVNRPALQLAGFYDHFDCERMQIIGYVEYTYMQKLSEDERKEKYESLLSYKIPCIVFCRNLDPDLDFLEIAEKHKIPILKTNQPTSSFLAEMIRWLNVQLAPMISIHGVLVYIYGEGVLIMGDSGIGKSEAALELIKRGHRLVSDDVVEIRKVSDETLIGNAPDVTKYLIELRGIGIIDVKMLFGVQSVKETQGIDLVIKLEEWSREKEYDRLGTEDDYAEFLGNKVVCHSIPIRPGRNLAVILESAAVNYRQKKMGYNAMEELLRRLQKSLGQED